MVPINCATVGSLSQQSAQTGRHENWSFGNNFGHKDMANLPTLISGESRAPCKRFIASSCAGDVTTAPREGLGLC